MDTYIVCETDGTNKQSFGVFMDAFNAIGYLVSEHNLPVPDILQIILWQRGSYVASDFWGKSYRIEIRKRQVDGCVEHAGE